MSRASGVNAAAILRVMTSPFLPLDTVAGFDAALTRSTHEPILIFKHSPTCGISAMAHADLAEWIARRVPLPVYVVLVRQQREVSAAIAAHFALRHESPQVLLVEGGQVRWHGSHFRVTPGDIEAALARLSRASLVP